jgi:hypothetical protein
LHQNNKGEKKSPMSPQKTMVWGQTVDGRARVVVEPL